MPKDLYDQWRENVLAICGTFKLCEKQPIIPCHSYSPLVNTMPLTLYIELTQPSYIT